MLLIQLVIFGFSLNSGFADDTVTFPDDFMFGVATSAYQIEGGWDQDGKGENNWDRVTHRNKSFIKDGKNADVTSNSYNLYEEDVKALIELGVTHYRFSISWSRVLPDGSIHKKNQKGIDYYKNLLKELKKHNIEPFVTIFHWDTPQYIEELGGWPDENIVGWFKDYAKLCFDEFGEYVQHWLTFNEAKQTCTQGYGVGDFAPAIKSPGIGEYLCIHNVIKAHAEVWHLYNDEYKQKQNGKVGIVIDSNWWEPATSSEADQKASEKRLLFTFGMYAHPIFTGDYPQIVKETIERRSLAQGFKKSRLPEFTDDEKKYINQTIDFLGVNQYSTSLVTANPRPDPEGMGYEEDSEVLTWYDPSWPQGACDWLVSWPQGIYKLLTWVHKTYSSPEIYITENGWSDADGNTTDPDRIRYINDYLCMLHKALDEKVNIKGYTVWSLVDNFEWTFGFTNKFGLYQVDFDKEQKRTAKDSAKFYSDLIKNRKLNCKANETIKNVKLSN